MCGVCVGVGGKWRLRRWLVRGPAERGRGRAAGEAEHAKRALAKREKKIPEVDPAWGIENDGS